MKVLLNVLPGTVSPPLVSTKFDSYDILCHCLLAIVARMQYLLNDALFF